jgi:DNA-binding transcriptional LysR family regulator
MLALSQSAVSAALTDLEGQLSVQLFDRVGKRLVVNEHGRLLYPARWRCWNRRRKLNNCFGRKRGNPRLRQQYDW